MKREDSELTEHPVFQNGLRLAQLLMQIHRYEVVGLENLPKKGPALLAVSHSFATYDSIMIGAKIYLELGRHAASLADRRIFQTPLLGDFFTHIGSVEGTHEAAERFLREGKLLALSPGGMRESLRPSTQKYRVDWAGRLGFVRLSVKMQVPVHVAVCPAADDIFTLYENPVTPFVYKNFKWPLPVLRGWGLTLVPRPVKLVHYVSKGFKPPKLRKGEVNDQDVEDFHAELVEEMERLFRQARKRKG